MTLHEKTKHIALEANLRYRPKQLPKVINGDFDFFTWIDRGLLLYIKIYFVASRTLYRVMAQRSQPCSYIARSLHGPVAVREVWQLYTKKSPVTFFFGFVCLQSLETLVFCFFSIETFAAALIRTFNSHCTLLISMWWAGPTHIDKQ